ncbi:MAG: TonB-dependent receptor, partial [Porticoccaceae bacterium]|nr:TonB-dependent receptor [Porticoccaceae bacterium]
SLPQNYSSVNVASSLNAFNNDAPGFFNPNLQGNATANLRGFGSDATLVLVNGRRLAGAPVFQGGAVNLSTIPVSAIERVEVLNDGASSIYGSDAVAGVINFILKKSYTGAESAVRYDNGKNGGNRYSFNQLFGTSWDGGRLMAALSYDETSAVSSAKAGWTTRDLRSRGGQDSSNRSSGQPGVISEAFFGETIGALPQNSDGTNYTEADVSPDNIIPDPSPLRQQLTSATKNYSLHVNVEQALGESLQAFVEATYAVNENINESSTPSVALTVPESNAFNQFGRDVDVSYIFNNEVARGLVPSVDKPINELESITVNTGITWEMTDNWSLKATAGYNQSASDTNQLTLRSENNPRFTELLNSSDRSVALNFFGNGSAQSPRIGELFGPDPFGEDTTSQYSLNLSVEGGLFNLPGGESRLAFGGEYRAIDIEYQRSDAITNPTLRNPKQDVFAVFSELSVPLVGEANQLPGIKSLFMTLGARWEKNDFPQAQSGAGSSFSQTSPRVTLAWKPVDSLTLRTTRSESFRAPLLTELLTPQRPAFFTFPFFDPFHPGGGRLVNPPETNGGNPNLKAETADTFTLGFDWRPEFIEGLELSVTYNKIDQQNRITTLNTIGGTPLPILLANSNFAIRNSAGAIVRLNGFPINVARRLSKSTDFNINYAFDTDLGAFKVDLTGTYTGELADTITPGAEVIKTDRTVNGPDQWRTRLNLGWSTSDMGADLFVNHSNSYNNNATGFSGVSNRTIARVKGYTTIDVSGFYNLNEHNIKLSGGIRNLLDESFPFVDLRGMPFDTSRIDTRGRTIYVNIKKDFTL